MPLFIRDGGVGLDRIEALAGFLIDCMKNKSPNSKNTHHSCPPKKEFPSDFLIGKLAGTFKGYRHSPPMLTSLQALTLALIGSTVVSSNAASICFRAHQPEDGRRCWSFDVGVAFITSNDLGEILTGNIDIADGPAGGEIYSLTATRRLGEFKLELWGHTFHPQVELPLTLEIVDENSRSPFVDFNASVVVRWEEFPWNHVIKTTVATGIGLSYSQHVLLMDKVLHPGTNRSHLKFNWPIQMTFALPSYPEHQLMLYIAHKSGGEVFDRGGINSVGFGYRFGF